MQCATRSRLLRRRASVAHRAAAGRAAPVLAGASCRRGSSGRLVLLWPRATAASVAAAATDGQQQRFSPSEAFVRSWNRAARPVLDGLASALASQAAAAAAEAEDDDDDGSASPAAVSPLLVLYADAFLALLRDAEGTARQAWYRHPDAGGQGWRAAGRRVAEDAARVQARLLLLGAATATATTTAGGGGSSKGEQRGRAARPQHHRLLRRALLDKGREDGGRSALLCRALVEQLDFRIAGALAAEAEAEAGRRARAAPLAPKPRRPPLPPPPSSAARPRGRRTWREEEQADQEGGMWRAALEMQLQQQQQQRQQQKQQRRGGQGDDDPRRKLLLALHEARQGEAAAAAAVAAAAAGERTGGGGGPELVELEGAELVRAAAAVPGLAPYLLLPPPEQGEAAAAAAKAAAAPERALLALALPAVRRCLLLSPPREGGGGDCDAACSAAGEQGQQQQRPPPPPEEALRRLAYERALAPAVEAAAAALPEVWRCRAEAARCVEALMLLDAEGRLSEGEAAAEAAAAAAAAAVAAASPDAPRRLCPDPDAALAFLFDVLDAIRPAADAAVGAVAGAAPWDVERLLHADGNEEEQDGDGDDDGGGGGEAEEAEAEGGAAASFALALASHLRLGGVLRGLARASAELLGVEITELPPAPHPDRPPDLPDHCPAFAVAVVPPPQNEGAGGASSSSRAGVLALDPCARSEGGYGTRVVRLRFPVASAAEGGPDALVPSPAHALVAIGLGLEAAEAGRGRASSSSWAEGGGGGPLPVDDPSSYSPPSSSSSSSPASPGRSLRLRDVEDEVLPPSALWELAHEFGHALHLLLSNHEASHQAGAAGGDDDFAGTPLQGAGTHHLAGRFLPSDALEVPSHLFERLMLEPAFLSRVCLAFGSESGGGGGGGEAGGGAAAGGPQGTPLALPAAARLARRLRHDYASALTVQDRAVAAVAEQLCILNAFYGAGRAGEEDGGDGEAARKGAGAWASVRASASSLGGGGGDEDDNGGPAEPAAFTATLRQAAMLPVVARHRGTYYSYSLGWVAACVLGEEALAPLVRAAAPRGGAGNNGGEGEGEGDDQMSALRRRVRAAFCAHAGLPTDELVAALGLAPPPALCPPLDPARVASEWLAAGAP